MCVCVCVCVKYILLHCSRVIRRQCGIPPHYVFIHDRGGEVTSRSALHVHAPPFNGARASLPTPHTLAFFLSVTSSPSLYITRDCSSHYVLTGSSHPRAPQSIL